MDHSENVAFLMLIMSVVLQTYYPSLAFSKNTVFDALEKGKKNWQSKDIRDATKPSDRPAGSLMMAAK